MREHLRLFGHFLTKPVLTGAIAPSSRRLAERMIEGVELTTADTGQK
jgi:phospholipid N-methyltransferase